MVRRILFSAKLLLNKELGKSKKHDDALNGYDDRTERHHAFTICKGDFSCPTL